jgi:hypothetical protein
MLQQVLLLQTQLKLLHKLLKPLPKPQLIILMILILEQKLQIHLLTMMEMLLMLEIYILIQTQMYLEFIMDQLGKMQQLTQQALHQMDLLSQWQ